MRFRAIYTAFSAALLVLAATTPAFAENGEGLVGDASDQLITWVSLGVIAFFPAFIFVASAAQAKLEKRKEEKKAAALRQRTGW